MANNARITKETVYEMFSSLQKNMGDMKAEIAKDIGGMKGELGKVVGKVDSICQDLIGMKKTQDDHSVQIGDLTGTTRTGSRWGGYIITGLITVVAALILFIITHGGTP